MLVGLLLGAVGTPAGVGTAATGGPEDRIGEYETVAATFRFTIDTERKAIVPVQTSATHQVVTAGGKVVRSEPMKVSARPATAAEAQGEYTCVHRGGGDRALVIYQPMTLFFQSRSIYTQYIVHPYMVPNARQITSGGRTYWTRQLELCTVGGGHLTNGWHQTLNGSTVTLVSPVNRLIGSMWGTEVVNGAVSSTLGVQAGTDPLKVTGSVSVQQQDNHSGNLGPNEVIDAMTDPPLGGTVNNRVNAYYVAPTNWKWDGTSDFQGNTGQALYEMPMSETSFTYAGALGFRVHCSINAPPWDKEPCGEL